MRYTNKKNENGKLKVQQSFLLMFESQRLMQMDGASHNICVLLAKNVSSVCVGLKVWTVSNYMQQVPTSANIVASPCKWTQQVGPNNVAYCWPTMLCPFPWALMQLGSLRNSLGRDCQRERYKTTNLIREYNNFTWKQGLRRGRGLGNSVPPPPL